MKTTMMSILATAIVAAQLISVGLAAVPASAQETTQRRISRQQQIIQQQQRQILKNQRLLESQQLQISNRRAAGAGDAGSSSMSVFDCPPHYYHSFVRGCLPDLNYLH